MEVATLQDLERFKNEILSAIAESKKTTQQKAEKWVKAKRAREILKCSAGTLQNLRQSNSGLKFTRVGGTIYYDVESIYKLLERD